MTLATISIVSHGHERMLSNLLSDLETQDGIEHFKVIVTLNLASESLDVSAYNLNIIVIHNLVPLGFAANHNAAFSYCNQPWFIVMNPDIRLASRRTLLGLVSQVEPSSCLLAPKVYNSDGRVEDSVRSNLTPFSLALRAFGYKPRYQPINPARRGDPFYWVAGMCLVIKTECFKSVNGFDEGFFLYCEDYDLCLRLYLAGYSIEVLSHVSVIHDAQRGSHRSIRHLGWHLKSLLRVWSSKPFWRLLTRTPL